MRPDLRRRLTSCGGRAILEANNELSESNRQHLREMERYTAATHCRHRALVEYFGQSYRSGPAVRRVRLVPG